MDAALAGDHPVLGALRLQLEGVKVREREMTGVGFFVYLEVARAVPRAPTTGDRVVMSDVGASVNGFEHGLSFILFISDGYLDLLEGFTNAGEPWPERLEGVKILYASPGEKPGEIRFEPGTTRDLGRLSL